MSTIAYQYGLLDPLDWAQDCHEHLWLQNKLWNTLVEIERAHREKYRAIVGSNVEVAQVQVQIDAIKARQLELREQRKLMRKQARAKAATPGIDEELRELSRHIQPLIEAVKPLRKTAKEGLREQIKALDSERFNAVKVARNASGLWWGNYNAVCASYEAARSKAMRDNAELKFHGFRGEGRFTSQLIGGASVEQICAGHSQVHIDLRDQPVPDRHGQLRPGKHRPRLAITVYTDDSGEQKRRRLLTFPIIYDRPLPLDCRIQQVVVTRRKLGTRYRYAVVFTCRIPDAPLRVSASAKRCGINLGFRQHADGLRVATIADAEGVRAVCLSPQWVASMDDVEAIQQRRDGMLNEISAVMKAQWPSRPAELPEEIATRLQNLVNAPKFGAAKLAALVLRWREHEVWTQMRERLETWRKQDKHWLEIQDNQRDKLWMHRREVYRLLARSLAQEYGEIRIGKVQLKQLARLEHADGADNELHQRARRNRGRASLYSLQSEIAQQAAKSGAAVVSIDPPYSSICHRCAGSCVVGADLMHVCEHCSAVWDQDENAALNIFAAARERSSGALTTGQRSQDAASVG